MLSVCLGLLRKPWLAEFCENCCRKFIVCRFCASEPAAGADCFVSLAASEISDVNDPSVFLPALVKSFVVDASEDGVAVASANLLNASAALACSADCIVPTLFAAKLSAGRAAEAAA